MDSFLDLRRISGGFMAMSCNTNSSESSGYITCTTDMPCSLFPQDFRTHIYFSIITIAHFHVHSEKA